MELERVSCRVPTRAPTGQTHAYVLGSEDALLVDPAARVDGLDALLDRIGHVALTHHHPDHVGAVADYAEATGATVWSRVGREAAFEAATGIEPDRTFADGTGIETGDGVVEVVDTPGHAPEHVGFRFPGEDGDLDREAARQLWEELAASGCPEAVGHLAKHYEHQVGEPCRALAWAERLPPGPEHERRRQRLRAKCRPDAVGA